jgi:hypothetical protein
MKKRQIISTVISISLGVVGALFLYIFFNHGYRNIIELVLGISLLFVSVYNIIIMLRHVR